MQQETREASQSGETETKTEDRTEKMPMLETQQASLRRAVTRTRPLRAKWGLGTGENNETAGGRSV